MPPAITSVSGTIAHGQSVSISGSGFGTKGGSNASKPLVWADFEANINPTSLGIVTTWSDNTNFVLNTASPQYGLSTQNVKGTWSTGINSFSFGVVRTFSDKLYMYGTRYFDFTMTANQKFFRLWSNLTSEDVVASTSNNGICLDEFCSTQVGRFQAITALSNQWLLDEFRWQKATTQNCAGTNSGNGLYEYVRNGTQQQILNGTLADDPAANYGQGSGLRVFDNFTDSANLPANGVSVYQDNLYVDDTWAHVIIGNNSTLGASTQREIQIPSAWADGSITVTINRGAFGASDSAWLYVIDVNNVASSSFAITFGGATASGTPVDHLVFLTEIDRTVL